VSEVVIEIIKVKGSVPWAIRATVNGISRYRIYRYKKEAEANLHEWTDMHPAWFYPRNFNHNFHSAEECGIKEI